MVTVGCSAMGGFPGVGGRDPASGQWWGSCTSGCLKSLVNGHFSLSLPLPCLSPSSFISAGTGPALHSTPPLDSCVHSQSRLTVCSSVHGIFQIRTLEPVAISFRESSQLEGQTHVSCISCIGRQVLYQLSHRGSPHPLPLSLPQIFP